MSVFEQLLAVWRLLCHAFHRHDAAAQVIQYNIPPASLSRSVRHTGTLMRVVQISTAYIWQLWDLEQPAIMGPYGAETPLSFLNIQ
jgi:hypothetical protein